MNTYLVTWSMNLGGGLAIEANSAEEARAIFDAMSTQKIVKSHDPATGDTHSVSVGSDWSRNDGKAVDNG